MDFPKFVSLISRSELYLSNLEVLSNSDPHEGLLSHPNYRHRQWNSVSDLSQEEMSRIFSLSMSAEEQLRQFEAAKNHNEYWLRRRFHDRRCYFVHCWHQNPDESAAMWKLYAGTAGIAITTNYERIIGALHNSPPLLFFGQVQYLDWTNDAVNNTFSFPLSKRRSFVHENEWRLIFRDLETESKLNYIYHELMQHTVDRLHRKITAPINWSLVEDKASSVPFDKGKYIPVDLKILIDGIYISPTADGWFRDVVMATCEKFGIDQTPKQSDLLSVPLK